MKAGLIITTFNRPAYLKRCLESVKRSNLTEIDTVMIIDDCSTDKETIKIINDFELHWTDVIKVFSRENRSIKGSLRFGFDILFNDHDLVINLDGDAIVRMNFVERLLCLKDQFPNNIVCGFNTTVKNRNPIIAEYERHFEKKYASGINMVINKEQYEKYILPGLLTPHNWDFEASKLHEAAGKSVIVAKPSVIQHIGIEESSMGHISASEPPDVAQDFEDDDMSMFDEDKIMYRLTEESSPLRVLKKVTLIAVDDNVDGIIRAADISQRGIIFGAVKLLSSMPSEDSRVIPIRKLGSKRAYSEFLMKEIVDFIDTPYFITIQADGYILDGMKFNQEWFNYDYIGSPWHWYTDGMNVGNGAMSFRSRRLHEILKEDSYIVPINDHLIKECEEDHNICRIYRRYLENKYDIKFAPLEVAEKFGIEAWGVKPPANHYNGQFGFHGHIAIIPNELKNPL